MTTKWATSWFLVGALIAPLMGHTADTQNAPSRTEKAKEYVEDAAITARIKAEFAKDKQVTASQINVDTDHGVVKLSGNAKSREEAQRAVTIAQDTKGVVSVDNKIQVGAGSAGTGATKGRSY